MPRIRRCRQYGCHSFAKMPNHYCIEHIEREQEYLNSRAKWARAHSNKAKQHKYNTVDRYANEDKSEQYKFYRTRQWAKLRQEVLDRDSYMCQYCQAIGKFTPNSNTVDHIVPIEVDQSLMASKNNLATICRSCHRLKTDWEQQYYGTGKGNKLTGALKVDDVGLIVRKMF